MTSTIALTIFLITAIALIVIVLLQQSKGAGMGASFGSGASGTVFGSKGAGSFLYKLTCVLALVFFISSLAIVYLQNKEQQGKLSTIYGTAAPAATTIDTPTSSANDESKTVNPSNPAGEIPTSTTTGEIPTSTTTGEIPTSTTTGEIPTSTTTGEIPTSTTTDQKVEENQIPTN